MLWGRAGKCLDVSGGKDFGLIPRVIGSKSESCEKIKCDSLMFKQLWKIPCLKSKLLLLGKFNGFLIIQNKYHKSTSRFSPDIELCICSLKSSQSKKRTFFVKILHLMFSDKEFISKDNS